MVSVTEPCGDWACPSHPFAEVHRGVWEPAVFTQEHAEIERLLGSERGDRLRKMPLWPRGR
jgi:hypothetical protein